MRTRLLHGILAATLFIGLSVLLVGVISSGHPQAAAETAGSHAGDRHDHGDDQEGLFSEKDAPRHPARQEGPDPEEPAPDEESDGHTPAAAPDDEEALLSMRCEHGTAIVQCHACRYEVGVVRLEPALSERLIKTQIIEAATPVETILRLTGEVQLDLAHVVEVASAGSGRVERLDKILGDRVEASTPLAVIQSSEFGQAQADYLALKAELDLAQATFEREDRLYREKISSEADLLAARNAFRSAAAALVAAKKRLQLYGLDEEQVARFTRQQTQAPFGQLVLTAPVDGVITRQNIVRGRLVNPGDTLYTIADLSRVWVWCDVYERDLAALHQRVAGEGPVTAAIRVAAFPGEVFEGTVDMIGDEVNRETRTIKVRVMAANPEAKLKPGMFAEVAVELLHRPRAIRIPETAVLSDAADQFVFEHLADDLWIRRDIVRGDTRGGLVTVLRGLTPGATIVTRGAFMFKSEVLKEKMGAGCAH